MVIMGPPLAGECVYTVVGFSERQGRGNVTIGGANVREILTVIVTVNIKETSCLATTPC